MDTKYSYNKKAVIVLVLSVSLVITGIYLFLGISSNKTDAMGIMGNGGGIMSGGMAGGGTANGGMVGGGGTANGGMMGGSMMGMMGMGNMMTGKIMTNMGHGMFPQYKGVRTGPALFHYEGCIMCHTINGLGGGIMGPNLSHIGSIRSFSWIATQIADPSAHFKRGSLVTLNGLKYRAIMPSFKNMSSKDVGILSKYLESLK